MGADRKPAPQVSRSEPQASEDQQTGARSEASRLARSEAEPSEDRAGLPSEVEKVASDRLVGSGRRAEDSFAGAQRSPEPVLREGMSFEGLLVLPQAARIDGLVRGEVLAGAAVWVGATGVVEADLEADAVVVEGRVDGDLRARSRVELGSAAVVRGDLITPRLAMADGARVDGHCQCGSAPGAP